MIDTYLIRIKGDRYSENAADRCISSIDQTGSVVGGLQKFDAITPEHHASAGPDRQYTYPMQGESKFFRLEDYPVMKLEGYRARDYRRVWAAAMSHAKIWETSIDQYKPLLILEHDTVFTRKFDLGRFLNRIDDGDIAMINDPRGCTRRGNRYFESIVSKGSGVHPVEGVNDPKEKNPDGLAGGSAYVITPKAAMHAIDLLDKVGVWPNDALLCKQFFTGEYALKASCPFYTKPIQGQSTTTG